MKSSFLNVPLSKYVNVEMISRSVSQISDGNVSQIHGIKRFALQKPLITVRTNFGRAGAPSNFTIFERLTNAMKLIRPY